MNDSSFSVMLRFGTIFIISSAGYFSRNTANAAKNIPRIKTPVNAHNEGRPINRGLSVSLGADSLGLGWLCCGGGWTRVSRNSLQNRHLMAAPWMASAQKGHNFVVGLSDSILVTFRNYRNGLVTMIAVW